MMRFNNFLLMIVSTSVFMFFLTNTAEAASGKGFCFEDKTGEYMTVLLDGKIVARYMYAHDRSTPERAHETYKPYLHVFDAEGKKPITKGQGGKYTHHRGIFIGWNRIHFKGERYDRWHMKGGEIVHQSFKKKEAGPDTAILVSLTEWNDNDDNPILDECRTMTFRRAPDHARLVIDFKSTLTASYGDINLKGDPEHAGIQYRPGNDIVAKKTVYVFSKKDADPKKDLDYPWVGESYTLYGKRYSIVHMNHPDNPKGTKYSAYRDYGRFGAFFEKEIESERFLTVKYRFLICDGEMPSTRLIQKCWKKYAGAKDSG